MKWLLPVVMVAVASGQQTSQPVAPGLTQVKRIYVGPLTGSQAADAMRDLLVASIDSTKLFVLTDNPDRADAVLKGAAEDNTYTDTFDVSSSVSTHQTIGKYSSGSGASRSAGGYLGGTGSEAESHHSKERKHEAYATVRLCNRDGDVLWSTTQESLGAKFRSASTDVAAKVARQLVLDMDRARGAAK